MSDRGNNDGRGGRGRGRGGDRGGGRGGRGRGEAGRGAISGNDRGGRGGGGGFDRGRTGSPGGRGGFRGGEGRGGFGGDRGRGGYGDRGRGGDRGGFRGRGAPPREAGGIFSPNEPANVDDRLTGNEQSTLINSFKNLSINSTDIPLRPGWGTIGTAIKLRSNYFAVKLPRGSLYEYDIKITPSVTAKRVKRRIFELLENAPDYTAYKGYVAHDSSAKLIAAQELPQPISISVPFYDEDQDGHRPGDKTYTVEVTFIQPIDTTVLSNYLSGDLQFRDYDPQPVLAALNIVLAQHPSKNGVMVGRNRFFFPEQTFSLGGGLEAWKGFYSSVRPTYNQLMVNVNVATTAFYSEGNLANAMIEFRRMTYGARIDSFVRGVRVEAIHLHYKKTVKRTSHRTARQHKFFWDEENRQVSVEEYFKKKYSITLQHADDVPLVDVGGQKQNLMPAELCQILPGQPFRGKLTDDHTAAMILHACKPPNVNANSIVGAGLSSLGFTDTVSPLPGFGISIGTQMAVVPGRILKPPSVMYAQRPQAIDEKASWNLRSVKFSQGARLWNWAVLVIKDGNERDEFQGVSDPLLKATIAGFVNMCRTSGMTVDRADPQYVAVSLPRKSQEDPTRKAAISAIRTTIMTLKAVPSKPTLILVMLSNGDKHIYSGLKHLCDVFLDVHTVCVHSSKIKKEKGQLQYFANVALKVNMKLGGVNHGLDPASMAWLKQKPTMLVGMDVTHPGPGSLKGTPSIAAVVGSIDAHFGQFPASLCIQETKKEMITSLGDMMKERLDAYKATSKTLPDRILVYRDGVSEGQFATVVGEEMPEIIKSFQKFDAPQKSYRPKLTIVVCGKRHHTRFYPTEVANADQLGNPRPGTVVDQGVTAVYAFDFFLQAHGGLQGTTRPTHYYVVHDEMQLTADQLQRLTNDVSYMFARATKAVSLVSPAYYADLACERGRCYIHELLQTVDSSTSSSDGQEVFRQAERLWRNGVNGPQLKNSMFYL